MGVREYKGLTPEYEFRDNTETRRRTEVRGHRARATNAVRRGLLDEAAKEAGAALEIDERSVDANTLLAVVEDRRGNNARAGGYYARAVELAPEQGMALNNYGAWLCGTGRAAGRLAWFPRAASGILYPPPGSSSGHAGQACLNGE